MPTWSAHGPMPIESAIHPRPFHPTLASLEGVAPLRSNRAPNSRHPRNKTAHLPEWCPNSSTRSMDPLPPGSVPAPPQRTNSHGHPDPGVLHCTPIGGPIQKENAPNDRALLSVARRQHLRQKHAAVGGHTSCQTTTSHLHVAASVFKTEIHIQVIDMVSGRTHPKNLTVRSLSINCKRRLMSSVPSRNDGKNSEHPVPTNTKSAEGEASPSVRDVYRSSIWLERQFQTRPHDFDL